MWQTIFSSSHRHSTITSRSLSLARRQLVCRSHHHNRPVAAPSLGRWRQAQLPLASGANTNNNAEWIHRCFSSKDGDDDGTTTTKGDEKKEKPTKDIEGDSDDEEVQAEYQNVYTNLFGAEDPEEEVYGKYATTSSKRSSSDSSDGPQQQQSQWGPSSQPPPKQQQQQQRRSGPNDAGPPKSPKVLVDMNHLREPLWADSFDIPEERWQSKMEFDDIPDWSPDHVSRISQQRVQLYKGKYVWR